MLRTIDRNSPLLTILFGVSCVLAVFLIIIFPDNVFQASLKGLEVWWKIVFPALLPFFILTDIVAGYGLFHSLGRLLQPVMRLLFRLPGEAGWAIACGMTAGFPTGAHATAELRRQGRLTVREGERLLALSHFCSPILLMHVVAIGFFRDVKLGWMLIIIHIASLWITGILLRGRSHQTVSSPVSNQHKEARPTPSSANNSSNIEIDPIASGPSESNAGFGKKLGDAVMSSIQRLMAIGGVMIVFSVMIELIQLMLGQAPLLSSVGITNGTMQAALSSVLEVHLGAFRFSEEIMFPHMLQVALLSSLFAWSGLSAHLQAQSITRKTGLRYRSFMYARLVHAIIAFIVTILLWKPLHQWLPRTVPGFQPLEDTGVTNTFTLWMSGWSTLLTMFTVTIVGLCCLSAICRVMLKRKQLNG